MPARMDHSAHLPGMHQNFNVYFDSTGGQMEQTTLNTTHEKKIIVVMPAYNAARTLKKTFDDLPHEIIDTVILVDDASQDRTVEIAHQLNLNVLVHDSNRGYGANQKTCYKAALQEGATIIAMVHPDYQYDPKLLPEIVEPLINGESDVVLGSRMLSSNAYHQGMPWWKYVGNKLLTGIENLVFGLNLSEYHTGYRAYSSNVLNAIDFDKNSDGFIFDQEIIAQIVRCNYRISEVPVPTRYFAEASSISFWNSVVYGLKILSLLCRYVIIKK